MTVILEANVQSGANDRIRQDLPRIVAGGTVTPEVPDPVRPARVADEVLARYTGQYELRPGAPMPAFPEAGGLRVDRWFLIPTSDTTFFSPQDFGTVTARFDAAGNVTHFDWAFLGGTVPMRRVGG